MDSSDAVEVYKVFQETYTTAAIERSRFVGEVPDLSLFEQGVPPLADRHVIVTVVDGAIREIRDERPPESVPLRSPIGLLGLLDTRSRQ